VPLAILQGTFGSVRRCVDATTGQSYAVKVIPKRSVTDTKDRASFIAREVHMWRMLAALSPRVAALQGAYQDNNNIFLVQELLLDDMQKLLEQEVGGLKVAETLTGLVGKHGQAEAVGWVEVACVQGCWQLVLFLQQGEQGCSGLKHCMLVWRMHCIAVCVHA
jgi:hypothetical protein